MQVKIIIMKCCVIRINVAASLHCLFFKCLANKRKLKEA